MKKLKLIKTLIGISILIGFTALNVTNYWYANQEWNSLNLDAINAKAKRMQQENSVKAETLYGYVIGYLNTANQKKITKEIPDFVNLTVQYAREFKISPYQCLTICQIETGFDLHKSGSHGEQGPAQLMPGTWKIYYKHFGYKLEDFYKWKYNYRVAMAHFAELLKQNHNNVALAIGEYNGGGKWANIKSSRNYVQRYKLANRGISKLHENLKLK